MLGTYPCSRGTCFAIVRSDDRGNTWVRVAAPPVHIPPSGGEFPIGALTFANREDGYAYGSSVVYWTKDGGATWQRARIRPLAAPYSILTTGGNAFALVNTCRSSPCVSYALASSAVATDSWRTTPLPGLTGEEVTLATFGSKVALIPVPVNGEVAAFLVSQDGGRSFSRLSSKGMGGVACWARPTSRMTLWGFCATGMLGYAARSTDGGRHFQTLAFGSRPLTNGAVVVPVTDDEALVLPRVTPDLWLTRDGGRTAAVTLRYPSAGGRMSSVAVVTDTTWLAIGDIAGSAVKLWRTTNAGTSWQELSVPGVKS